MNMSIIRVLTLIVVSAVIGAACGASVSTPTAEGPTSSVPATAASSLLENPPTSSVVRGEPDIADDGILQDLAAVPLDAIVAAYEANPPENGVQPNPDAADADTNGKPEVTYIGAEYCPYCAGERWALNVALSKFGEFSDLQTITSSEANVPTLSYVGSTFSSDDVVFNPIELQDQDGQPLEEATDAEIDVFRDLGGGAFPFVDFGGQAYQVGASVDIQLFIGKSQRDIAADLAASTPDDTDPDTIPGNVNAAAGAIISAICETTGGRPGEVCDAFDRTS